jgi:predicted DNA-binding transcriptional regulator AlpA
MKVLSQRDLQTKGITWSREHVRRKVKAGEFPSPFKLTDKGRNFWDEEAVDRWLEKRAANPNS